MEIRKEFLELLRTDSVFREEVRRQLLTDELLELPRRFAAFVEAADRRFAALERDVRDLKRDTRDLKGLQAESYYLDHGAAILMPYVADVHVMKAGLWLAGLPRKTRRLLQGSGLSDFMDIDFIANVRTTRGRRITLACEASWTVLQEDVERALRRSGFLKGCGLQAMAAVFGREVPEDLEALVRQAEVLVVRGNHILNSELLKD